MQHHISSTKIADRYLRSDLTPPLGHPGGQDHVIQRIRQTVHSPALAENLIDDVGDGDDLDNAEAAKIYDLYVEKPPAKTLFKKILLGTHAQYRMDLRGITVPEVRAALAAFNKAYLDGKSRNDPTYRRWADALRADTGITWTDPRFGLVVVFAAGGREPMSIAKIITTYRDGGDRPSSIRVARMWQAATQT